MSFSPAQLSQLFVIGLPADNALEFALEFEPGGVILMGRNARPASELRRLARELRDALKIAPWIASDHEGGRVQRLRGEGWSDLASAREIGARGARAVHTSCALAAAELRAAGLNCNFAPVADVPLHPQDTVIGDRAWSRDPVTAAALVAQAVRGFQPTVMACAKHFPGHGGVGLDSHHDLPTFQGSRADLEPHLLPFRAAIGAGVGSIMIGHLVLSCLDPSAPATLSAPVVTGLLRGEMGFRGLVVTDDLEMGALDGHEAGDLAVAAIGAGCDLLLWCHTSAKALAARQGLARALEEGRLDPERVADALERVRWAKNRFGVHSDP